MTPSSASSEASASLNRSVPAGAAGDPGRDHVDPFPGDDSATRQNRAAFPGIDSAMQQNNAAFPVVDNAPGQNDAAFPGDGNDSLGVRIASRVESFREHFGISGAVLKTIAVVSMFIDHAGASLVRRYISLTAGHVTPQQAALYKQIYYYMRRIGRLAFPIFCFMIVEGFLHTKDLKKYLSRMLLFAFLSEFPFDYALHHGQAIFDKQNVYFTLLIGLLVLTGIRAFYGRIPLQLAVMVSGMILARLLKTDYSYKGVFIIEMLYITRFTRFWQCACGASFMQYYEKMPTPLAFVPIWLYNGKRGRQHKMLYYFFYPGHLLLLGLLTWHVLPALLR